MQEKILYQQRVHKVPYRLIAERLGKTIGACRLHFHQRFGVESLPKDDSLPEQPTSALARTHESAAPAGRHHQSAAVGRALGMPATLNSPLDPGEIVDVARLTDIYHTHAGGFWGVVALDYYGRPSSSGRELENAFLTRVRFQRCIPSSQPYRLGTHGNLDRALGLHRHQYSREVRPLSNYAKVAEWMDCVVSTPPQSPPTTEQPVAAPVQVIHSSGSGDDTPRHQKGTSVEPHPRKGGEHSMQLRSATRSNCTTKPY